MANHEALVTAGGTIEAIDDVRVITNLSTGRFGHAIAAELSEQGIETTLLCPESVAEKLGIPDGVRHEPFTSAASLRERLLGRDSNPDVVFHAAAVSDYTPKKVDGKIRSDEEELVLTLVRTPKIIAELRDEYGPEAFIAGFKLLSGVSEDELTAVATQLLRDNCLDMVVANDLQRLEGDQHPIDIVTRRDGVIGLDGDRQIVAQQLVGFALEHC